MNKKKVFLQILILIFGSFSAKFKLVAESRKNQSQCNQTDT